MFRIYTRTGYYVFNAEINTLSFE